MAIKLVLSGRGPVAMTTISVNKSANQFLSVSVITVWVHEIVQQMFKIFYF